jgi:glycosyltransferase involved in cell wall biosynthesis
MSRLPLHGAFLYKLLNRHYDVIWIGRTFPFKITFLSAFPIFFLEMWKLLTNFKKLRFSLIVVQFVSLDGIIAVLFKRILKTKLVFFAVGSDILKVNDRAFVYPVIRFMISESDGVFCASTLVEEKLRTLRLTSKSEVVPSVVDLDDFEPYVNAKVYDVVTVGTIDSNKNQMLLLKACELLPKVKALVIGDGRLRQTLQIESAKRNLNMVFLGNIPHKQVFRELQKSRIYVHTSKSEGLPVAILEAMFSGLPVILVGSPYAYFLKNDGFSFHIANEDSPEDLANKISYISKNYMDELRNCVLNKPMVSELVSKTYDDIKAIVDHIF